MQAGLCKAPSELGDEGTRTCSECRCRGRPGFHGGCVAVQLLCFGLAARRYALDLASIERVVRAVALDRIPGLPPAIRGVFNLHGRLVPVGDMRHRLGLAAREIELDDRIVVTRAAGRLFGVVAEGGTEVVRSEEHT